MMEIVKNKPDKSLPATPINGIGTFSSPAAAAACPELRKFSRAGAFGVSLCERIAPWGHAPLRGSRWLFPSTLRSAATEDGRA